MKVYTCTINNYCSTSTSYLDVVNYRKTKKKRSMTIKKIKNSEKLERPKITKFIQQKHQKRKGSKKYRSKY